MQREWLTSATVFISGALLFILELLVARTLLPMVGGSALAWTTCVAFFQIILLLGALYAHLTARLGPRRQAIVHAFLLLAALAMLPLRINAPVISDENTILYMLRVLATSVGLTCFLLCTTTSLVMQWLVINPDQQSARAYAASNAGSLSGLVAYPFLIEPLLGLSRQASAWTFGFVILAALLALLILDVARSGANPQHEATPLPTPSPGTTRKWFILSFVPCALMLGVTSHMTNELPSFPLLWVVPLALYLISLVIAFASDPRSWLDRCLAIEPVLVGILVIVMFVPVKTSGFLIHLTAIFMVSLTLHGRLAMVEPWADRGAFVLWSCAGGAAAGIFNAVIAPFIFPFVAEFQLAIVAACLLRPMTPVRRPERWSGANDLIWPALLLVAMVAILVQIPRMGGEMDIFARLAVLFVGAGVAVIFRRRPVRYGLGMAAVIAAGFWTFQWDKVEMMDRSPYGVSRVLHDRFGKQMVLFHGTTIHGAQGDAQASSSRPRYYFHTDGPLGRMLSTGPARKEGRFFAVVGLGAGSLAWYLQPEQRMRFYEIDPVVERIAREPHWFTYLSSAKGKVDVVIGDGRLALAAEADRLFDVIILDAFSSDSAPTHLLTREALEIYLRKLKPNGFLVFNTSNRHIDLSAVVVSAAQSLGLQVRVTLPPAPGTPDHSSRSEFGTWAVVARDARDFNEWLKGDDRWVVPKGAQIAAWTDDRTIILPVLKW
jgi:predicted membrane-bound spermidine synthase